MPPKALLLAAGKSTRIHPVTKGLPKPLLEIDGEPIIFRNLRWLASQGIEDVFVNLHYRPDDIRAAVGDGARFGVRVTYSPEEAILGTAGAAKNLEAQLGDPFLVVYGDNLLSTDLGAMRRAHAETGATVTIALFDRERHPHTGIAGGRVRCDADGRITAFVEGASDEVSSLVNAGVYVVDAEAMARAPVDTFFDFGKDMFPQMLAEGVHLHGHQISEYCLGIDTPESHTVALELIASGRVKLR